MKMRKLLLTLLLPVACLAMATDYVDYVNPLMGTDSQAELSSGNTYPAIALPWGMNCWVPQTGKNGDGWQYRYGDKRIRGFKQTHQPSPWLNDYGTFSLMPTVGTPTFDEEQRASWFSHKSEVAKPYYYSVYLADHNVTAEMTSTNRCAMMQFTFPETDKANVVIDAFDKGSYVKIFPQQRMVAGCTVKHHGGMPEADNFGNFFVIVFDHPFSASWVIENGRFTLTPEVQCDHAGAVVQFKTKRGEKVHARIASSFISYDQALVNMNELGRMSFEQLKQQNRQQWNEALSRIEVKDDHTEALHTFYSCLYRSMLFPRRFYEVTDSGKVVHWSPYNGEVKPGYMFTDTGFWDTYRCLFPFLNLMFPNVSKKVQDGLVHAYEESGFLPEWASPGHRDSMVGNSSASVVADAYLSGLDGYRIDTLWAAVKHGANALHPKVKSTGRLGHELYNKLGYVPCDAGITESVSRTLEYAYDDWCIYQLGKKLGKPENEIAIYAQRAMNYKNVFDPETDLMRGRLQNGRFQAPFNPLKWGDAFTEGNAWHYTWSVLHNPQGLIGLMGGKARFNQMLDSVFTIPPTYDDSYYGHTIHKIREMQVMNMGNYAHGNQPVQHLAYLYNWSGQPWKTQYWVRQVMSRLYAPTPDGYCGDEDNGQTSAWYVFSALGFYPVCPGSGQYALGSPCFNKVTLHLENGKTVDIETKGAGCYIGKMKLNGKTYTRNYITLRDLEQGAKIKFEMTEMPNRQRGIQAEDAPYSFSSEKAK